MELLVGFALLAVLLGTANVLLFSALRSARKAGAVGVAKAEGSYAINAMVQKVKYASSISCNGGADSNRLNVVRTNGESFYYQFAAAQIASRAGALVDNLTSTGVVVSLCPDGRPVFRCDPTGSLVTICFAADVAGAPIQGETGAVTFQTQAVLRNFGN